MGRFRTNPEERFRTIPAGEYEVMVQKAELIEKEGKTPYIRTDFVIVEGENKNQHISDNISLSEKDGAKRRLAAFVHACGVSRGDDDYNTDELVGKLLVVNCKIEEASGQYAERIRPSSFKPHPSQAAAQTNVAPVAAHSQLKPAAPASRPAVVSAIRRPV